MTTLPPNQEDSRYAAVRQYSLAQILAVWAAAAIPMAVLAWVVAPLLGNLLGGDEGFFEAPLLCITAGLIWQFVLVLILTRGELGGLQWSRVQEPSGCSHPAIRGAAAWVEWSGGGYSLSSSSSAFRSSCQDSRDPRTGTSPSSWTPPVARSSFAERGADSRWSSCSPSSTPCSARSCSSGGFCCRKCGASLGGEIG
jgi:hypothetical protein